MNAEQKKRIAHEISNWNNAKNDPSAQITGDRMAALLQELIDAPEQAPAVQTAFCIDEGCPHYGKVHICVDNKEENNK